MLDLLRGKKKVLSSRVNLTKKGKNGKGGKGKTSTTSWIGKTGVRPAWRKHFNFWREKESKGGRVLRKGRGSGRTLDRTG